MPSQMISPILFLLVGIVVSKIPEEVVDQNIANRYADEITRKTVQSLIDVLELPDHNMTIAYKLLLAEIDVECGFTEGLATGMQSLQRHRDAEIGYRKRDMLVKLPSEFQNMTIQYKVHFKVWNSVFNIKLRADVRSSEVVATVNVPRNTNVVSLEDVSVRYLSGVKMDMRVLGKIRWLARPIAAKFVQFINDGVASAMEKYLRNIMEPVVASTLYPSVWN